LKPSITSKWYAAGRPQSDARKNFELGFPDGSNRYDGNKPYPHPHVLCIQCKKIIDPDLASLKDMTAEVADETGFKILTYRLDFFGICRDCIDKTER
jgi:Fur family peroxide stress response transcriptional regulator